MTLALRAVLAALLIIAGMGSAAAAADSVQSLKDFFSRVDSLQGRFHQETVDGDGAVMESSSGTMAISRPDRFRWVYQKPYEQVIVSDGKDLWVYDKDLQQVSVRPLKDMLAAGPALLLSGDYQALQRDFQVAAGDSPGWVRLRAKQGDWQFSHVRVHMDGSVPDRLELTDSLGQTTRLTLQSLQVNPKLSDGLFDFQPPAGVDVIGGKGAQPGQ